MKRFNKSKIMREANRLMRVEGYSRSAALTLAWSKARRNDFYWIIEVRKPRNIIKTFSMSEAAAEIYYSNGAYSND